MVVFAVLFVSLVNSMPIGMGKCPVIEPVKNFDHLKLEGPWIVVMEEVDSFHDFQCMAGIFKKLDARGDPMQYLHSNTLTKLARDDIDPADPEAEQKYFINEGNLLMFRDSGDADIFPVKDVYDESYLAENNQGFQRKFTIIDADLTGATTSE